MIYRAFGFEPPHFAHLPIILGTDRSKLSKRHGALSVLEYRKEGYLPDAIFNFLALLGWSPKTNDEIMLKDELVNIFSLDGISKSGSVFDVVKLKWMNGQYLRKMPLNELVKSIKPYMKEAGYKLDGLSDEWIAGLVDALHDNLNVLSDIKDHCGIFFEEAINYEDIKEMLYHKHTIDILNRFEGKLKGINDLSHDSVDNILNETVKEEGLKKPEVFKTIRGILTGRLGGPELWKVIKLFGREKVLQRIKNAREIRKI
jgi:nondiscriminating glutamyl-tRNA synthetase